MSLFWDDQEGINRFIGDRGGGYCAPGTFFALGWLEPSGNLTAGVSFYNTNKRHCFVSIALDQGFPRALLRASLFYSFSQLALRRLTFIIEADNLPSQSLVTRLGARLEATLRDAGTSGDLLIFSLFPEDCLIWKRLQNEQRRRRTGTG